MTGTQRYGHELLRSLDQFLSGPGSSLPAVTVLVPPSVKIVPKYSRLLVSQVGRFSGQIWEQFELPFYATGGLLFTPCGGAPILHPRNVITIHDAAVVAAPQGYSRAFRTWYRFLNRRLCRSALHVLTVSQFSKAQIVQWYGANATRVTVTYLGSDHALRPEPEPEILARNLLSRFKYVLLVGSKNPNKNLAGLLQTIPHLADSSIPVAIAGPSDAKVFGKSQIADHLVCDLGYVNDSELRTLYENAACFVFPSFYEGFGLPPLEALALGCPTVVADSTSLAEIFKSIAFMCNPHDPSDIADKILEACRAPQENRQQYREFAGTFRWDQCMKTTWDILAHFAEA